MEENRSVLRHPSALTLWPTLLRRSQHGDLVSACPALFAASAVNVIKLIRLSDKFGNASMIQGWAL